MQSVAIGFKKHSNMQKSYPEGIKLAQEKGDIKLKYFASQKQEREGILIQKAKRENNHVLCVHVIRYILHKYLNVTSFQKHYTSFSNIKSLVLKSFKLQQ